MADGVVADQWPSRESSIPCRPVLHKGVSGAAGEPHPSRIVYLDGFHMKVRMAKRVISVPVLAALGIAPDGQKRLLSLRLAVSEASTHWGSMLEGLQAQGLRAPKLVISDGHKGLTKALEKWPGCRVQRCTEHKRANLLQHCPAHARRELRRDYNRIVYAKNGIDARKAYDELVAK